jgi:dihydroorotate dehydrogenase electron transfer subunit
MLNHVYASSAIAVGKPDSGHSPVECPAEETLCPVVAHEWINDEYKHLVVKATPKALAAQPGQFFQLLCPSPDEGEVWFRRPQSVYRVARLSGRLEFLHKVVGAAPAASRRLHRDHLSMVDPWASASGWNQTGRTS